MDASDSIWGEWEAIRRDRDPDPLKVLRAAALYKRYFDAVEREGIALARKLGVTWEEIAAALGQSRQAVWQRAHRDEGFASSRLSDLGKAARAASATRWEAIKADPDDWYQKTRPLLPP